MGHSAVLPCTGHTTCTCSGHFSEIPQQRAGHAGLPCTASPLLFCIVEPVALSGSETFCKTPHHVHYPKSGTKLNKATHQPFCLHAFSAEWLKEPRLFAFTFFNTYCVMKTYELIGIYRQIWQTLYIYLGSEIIWTLGSLSLCEYEYFLLSTATC